MTEPRGGRARLCENPHCRAGVRLLAADSQAQMLCVNVAECVRASRGLQELLGHLAYLRNMEREVLEETFALERQPPLLSNSRAAAGSDAARDEEGMHRGSWTMKRMGSHTSGSEVAGEAEARRGRSQDVFGAARASLFHAHGDKHQALAEELERRDMRLQLLRQQRGKRAVARARTTPELQGCFDPGEGEKDTGLEARVESSALFCEKMSAELRALHMLQTELQSHSDQRLSTGTGREPIVGMHKRTTVGIGLKGRLIEWIALRSPAHACGKLRKGDQIVRVDGKEVGAESLPAALTGSDVPGSSLHLEVLRRHEARQEDALVLVELKRVAARGGIIHYQRKLRDALAARGDAELIAMLDLYDQSRSDEDQELEEQRRSFTHLLCLCGASLDRLVQLVEMTNMCSSLITQAHVRQRHLSRLAAAGMARLRTHTCSGRAWAAWLSYLIKRQHARTNVQLARRRSWHGILQYACRSWRHVLAQRLARHDLYSLQRQQRTRRLQARTWGLWEDAIKAGRRSRVLKAGVRERLKRAGMRRAWHAWVSKRLADKQLSALCDWMAGRRGQMRQWRTVKAWECWCEDWRTQRAVKAEEVIVRLRREEDAAYQRVQRRSMLTLVCLVIVGGVRAAEEATIRSFIGRWYRLTQRVCV